MSTKEYEQGYVENRPPIVPLVLWPGASPIYVPRKRADDAASLLKGERALLPEPSEPEIRRILDLCPGAGEFSVYCRLRFPVAWVDMVAHDNDEELLCRANAAPGARVLRAAFDVSSRYDLVRFDDPISVRAAVEFDPAIVFLDGCLLGEISGFALAAQGMRAKGRGWQYWVRQR